MSLQPVHCPFAVPVPHPVVVVDCRNAAWVDVSSKRDRHPACSTLFGSAMNVCTSTDEGFPIKCEICGASSLVNVSRPPGDSVCPACGSFLWVAALADLTCQSSFVPDLRIPSLDSANRDDAIRETTQAIATHSCWTNAQRGAFAKSVLKREELGSTGIGRGFAVPHAKVDWIDTFVTAMALAPEGIPFNASDGKPVHTIILIASPLSKPRDHLRMLERVSFSLRRAS